MTTTAQKQQQQKLFKCYTCETQVKLQRDEINQKWLKFNPEDGSPHRCQKQQKQAQEQPRMDDTMAQIIVLLEQALKLLKEQQQQAELVLLQKR